MKRRWADDRVATLVDVVDLIDRLAALVARLEDAASE